MDIVKFEEIGPMDLNSDDTDDLSEFLIEIMGEPILDTPMDYSSLESSLGRITDEDFFFKTDDVSIIEDVPFDSMEPLKPPPPIYVCNSGDYIKSAKKNGDILFNLILSICMENNGYLKRNESCLYTLVGKQRSEIMNLIGSYFKSEPMSSFNIKYNEFSIPRKTIVKLLRLDNVYKLFGNNFLSESTINGIVSALIKNIGKSHVKKLEYENFPKNSIFTLRVKY
jgi:hypothetical protein